jgi:pyruvate formate lyase activating enzyme
MQGVIFDIKRFAIHDGPGIRLTFFMKGCPLTCWWCHNPEALRKVPSSEEACSNGSGVERRIGIPELLDEVAKEQIFIDESGGGVTFSGGEPLVQIDFVEAALDACRQREVHTALDTTGYASREVFERVAGKADLFLFDLKLMDDEAHREYTGVPNGPIHRNLESLIGRGANVTIRVPIIPGITDTEANLDAMMEFLVRIGGVGNVCLLPYHKAASAKYRRLQMDNRVAGIEPPSDESMSDLRERFEGQGFRTQIGG